MNVIETLLLDGGVEDYEYLNKSRREVDGIDDKEEWMLLKVCCLLKTYTITDPFSERSGCRWILSG